MSDQHSGDQHSSDREGTDPQTNPRHAGDNQSQYRVLVVDDDQEFLRSIGRRFRRDPRLRLELASSPLQALRLLDVERFDAVLADWQMPTVNGSDLLALIAHRYPNIPRGLVTGYAAVNDVASAVNNGRVRWLFVKPLDAEMMRNQLLHVLDGRERTRGRRNVTEP